MEFFNKDVRKKHKMLRRRQTRNTHDSKLLLCKWLYVNFRFEMLVNLPKFSKWCLFQILCCEIVNSTQFEAFEFTMLYFLKFGWRAGCHLFDHHVTFKTIGDRLCVIISKFKRQTFRSYEAIQHTKCTLRFYRVEYSVI